MAPFFRMAVLCALVAVVAPAQTPCTLTVTSPNGGESFLKGETISVSWTASGSCSSATPVTVDLARPLISDASGAYALTYVSVLSIATNIEGGATTFTVPSLDSRGDYRIRVTDPVSREFDVSDTGVTISDVRLHRRLDMDGDGKADVFWSNQVTGDTAVWLMDGPTKTVGAWGEWSPRSWQPGGVGDFDGDGKADVLWYNSVVRQPAVWLMDGTTKTAGVYLPSYEFMQLGPFFPTAVADFTGDLRDEVLWTSTDPASGYAFLLQISGTSTSLGGFPDPIFPKWDLRYVGDFAGDGQADLLVRDSISGDMELRLRNTTECCGMTWVNGVGWDSVDPHWHIAGLADFDGDGKDDIFWRHDNGWNAIWLMDGATKKKGEWLETAPTNWSAVAFGDYDGDGKADVFWRDETTGGNAMWLMDGTTKRAGYWLESAPPGWHVVK